MKPLTILATATVLTAITGILGTVAYKKQFAVPEPSGALETIPASKGESAGGWEKYANNPVLGEPYGTCFDLSLLKEGDLYRMWFSWRPKKDIALSESKDGIHWSKPQIVLRHNSRLLNQLHLQKASGWEDSLSRPVVIKRGEEYHMWYTGFNAEGSSIGYATSRDGRDWKRMSNKPVLWAEASWEKKCVMNPDVVWDKNAGLFKMWYSGGERDEPDAIGYATSRDGLNWTKQAGNPIFGPSDLPWEHSRVAACQVQPWNGGYVIFYIGYSDDQLPQIGAAWSPDGIGNWQRHPANPILRPGKNQWDGVGCYKPYAICDGQKWMLWYNGRNGTPEHIGLAIHQGVDLGFNKSAHPANPTPSAAAQ